MRILLLALLFHRSHFGARGGCRCTFHTVQLAGRIDASGCYTVLQNKKRQICSIHFIASKAPSICIWLKLRSSWNIQITWLRGITVQTTWFRKCLTGTVRHGPLGRFDLGLRSTSYPLKEQFCLLTLYLRT